MSYSHLFAQVYQNWSIEQLFFDLTQVKGKPLTPLEKTFLQGLLCGYSPSEIARLVYNNADNSNSVRVYLSNGLYRYIRELLQRQTGAKVTLKGWSHVIPLLTGYQRSTRSSSSSFTGEDLQEKIKLTHFIGRKQELNQLIYWILEDKAHLIGIFALQGMGKTTLMTEIVQQIQSAFQGVIWRSMNFPISLNDLLTNLLMVFSQGNIDSIPHSIHGKICLFFKYLRENRYLLVFNHWDALYDPQKYPISYHSDHEAYEQFLQQLGQEDHQSCCLISSREKSNEWRQLQNYGVHSLFLKGLLLEDAVELLQSQGVQGSGTEYYRLINACGGHPLMLNLLISSLTSPFFSNITDFINHHQILTPSLTRFLDKQFDRLTLQEQYAFFTLLIHQNWADKGQFRQNLALLSPDEQLVALESLQARLWLDPDTLKLQPEEVWRVYGFDRFLQQIKQDLGTSPLSPLVIHLLQQTL